MKSRPILFSAPMVRALLAGTKTQTRRPLRDGTWLDPKEGVIRMCSVGNGVTGFQSVACPYGAPGDQLWVRESFIHEPADYVWEASVSIPCRPASTVYRADCKGDSRGAGWTSPMFMPRSLSRIALELTDVRVERLQDISEADALAEGIEYSERFGGYCIGEAQHFNSHDPRESYWSLWEAINGPGSVEANPWVWCLSFKRV